MRRYFLVICAAGAALAVAFAVLPQAAARTAPDGDMPHQSLPSPCTVTHTATASPDVLLLGEEVTITLGVQASCPDLPGPMHIMLVLDGSGTMAGEKNQEMRQAAARLIRGLDMPDHPFTKVGVVEFNSQARRLCSLTNDELQAMSCVNRVGANGGTRIDLGILEGLRVIDEGRPGINRDELAEVMIVLSDGGNNAGCAPVLAAARQARGQGILVIAVCVGTGCDEQCMRQVASGPRYYYSVPDPRDLVAAFDAILQQILKQAFPRLAISYAWGDEFNFIADSATPHQSEPDVPEGWLRWTQNYVGMAAPGVTYTMRLLPLTTGTQLVGMESTGELVDQRGRTISWRFDLPRITVLEPGAPPTATVTPIASSTPTASPTPTSTPTATATPTPRPAYLPRALREP